MDFFLAASSCAGKRRVSSGGVSSPGRDDDVSRPEKKRNNAAFAKDPERRLARLRTTRAVAEGEELTAAYGAQYWRLKAAKG